MNNQNQGLKFFLSISTKHNYNNRQTCYNNNIKRKKISQKKTVLFLILKTQFGRKKSIETTKFLNCYKKNSHAKTLVMYFVLYKNTGEGTITSRIQQMLLFKKNPLKTLGQNTTQNAFPPLRDAFYPKIHDQFINSLYKFIFNTNK